MICLEQLLQKLESFKLNQPVRRPLVVGQLCSHHRGVSASLLWALPPRVHLDHVGGQVGFGLALGTALLADDVALLRSTLLLLLLLL